MAVTKQTYTLSAGWTASQLTGIYRSAFIDAGLMTEWYDSFNNSSNYPVRVLEVDYDPTKTYGKTYYVFYFEGPSWVGVSVCSGWDATNHIPTGTQGLDYHVLPNSVYTVGSILFTTRIELSMNSGADLSLVRYTSGADVKQSWFMLYHSGTSRSRPFTILHPNTSLYSWLDLDKGIVSGFIDLYTYVSSRSGFVSLRMPENIRRSLLTGYSLRGSVNSGNGNGIFHNLNFFSHCYAGLGNQDDSGGANYSNVGAGNNSCTFLPMGRLNANPAFTSDYVPICSGVPWSAFTSTPLASDFAVYMHYADNNITLLDTFVVSSGVEEWETVSYENNAAVNDGASPLFLARVV
jgi:hypothetical protein